MLNHTLTVTSQRDWNAFRKECQIILESMTPEIMIHWSFRCFPRIESMLLYNEYRDLYDLLLLLTGWSQMTFSKCIVMPCGKYFKTSLSVFLNFPSHYFHLQPCPQRLFMTTSKNAYASCLLSAHWAFTFRNIQTTLIYNHYVETYVGQFLADFQKWFWDVWDWFPNNFRRKIQNIWKFTYETDTSS